MKDIEIKLLNKPGELARLGETLGRNNISLEGGGAFSNGEYSAAHFLVEEFELAEKVLREAGIEVITISEVVIQKLNQGKPGQLGLFCRKLANAGVNILVQYSDHANQLIIVPDDLKRAQLVSQQWKDEQ